VLKQTNTAEGLEWSSLPQRKSKEISLADAGKIIASKKIIGIAGGTMVSQPMALIREGIRAGMSGVTVIPEISSAFGPELMIATGVVDTLVLSYLGFETLGLSPAMRYAAENNKLNIVEGDEAFILHGTRAAAAGLPFIPLRHVYEATDLPKYNPFLKTVIDPYTGESVTTIPALKTDICLIHAQEADEYGNTQYWGGNQQEIDKAKASDIVIVSAERIVPVSKSRRDPYKVQLPGYLVNYVVHAPFGAHPMMCADFYLNDEAHLKCYVEAFRKGQSEQYLDTFVRKPKSHTEYLQAVGLEKLLSLMRLL
jgi:glutaconate CoA-transferase subunit A